ncbi:alpha-glycosidase [Croceivirga radicis]|uniref:Alpha-glycosidase n=1 Tax=Croceivirga radicis TaxID=1929488 RepID=A0A1V6LPB4_9FLAO|nr:TIM-barrel domain-containing protein [Croceivirga radicis]OQD42021.1 alpha-glycosidase [Croceivirga radicis]
MAIKKIKLLIYLQFAFVFGNTFAQENLGDYQSSLKTNPSEYIFTTTKGKVRIQILQDNLVRISTSWEGDFYESNPLMVPDKKWPTAQTSFLENETFIELVTNAILIKITKSPFKISFLDTNRKTLLGEGNLARGGFKSKEKVGFSKTLEAEEHFFGLGERMDVLDRKGTKTKLNVGRGQGLPHIVGAYNILEANYSPIPFLMSTKGYGLFFNTAYPTEWDLGYSDTSKITATASGGKLDYYFMAGPSFKTILSNYTALTGRAPLLPKFAHGLHVGTYSGGTWGHEAETSDTYVVELAKKFRANKIPVDVLHLDSTWRIFGENGGKGATSFEWRDTFRNPKAMFDSVYAQNFSMVGVHLRPRFDNGKTMRLLDKARALNHVYPEPNGTGEFVNFFEQSAVDWWWSNGVMNVAKQGAMFLKTDEGSAFGHKANESDKTGPQGKEIVPLHNLFPLAYARAPFLKFQDFNKVRGLNLTREGYAGIQRYPYIFAGDWPSEWQYFEPVILAGLNIGMSGVGYWGHCMGGFEHVSDVELYMRWVQFGMLSPVAHLFGMEHPSYKEPWNYGEEALANFKKYDELRYKLLPYIYSSAYQQYKTGVPLMRALVLDHQDDEQTYGITDQYMFGPNLLVCPVTTKGAQTRVVYLPEGKWIDFWSGEIYDGKQRISVLTPKNHLPLFVRSGSIIPQQKLVQFIDKEPVKNIWLHFYGNNAGEFNLYDDDGSSMAYQTKNDFALTKVKMTEWQGDSRQVFIEKPTGNYRLNERNYWLKFNLEAAPSKVVLNNKPLAQKGTNGNKSPHYSYENGELQVFIPQANLNSIILKIFR